MVICMYIIHQKQRIRNRSYIIPDLTRSYEEYLRTLQLDIREFDDIELYAEEVRVKIALANLRSNERKFVFINATECVSAQMWLLQRIAVIKAEKRRREGGI